MEGTPQPKKPKVKQPKQQRPMSVRPSSMTLTPTQLRAIRLQLDGSGGRATRTQVRQWAAVVLSAALDKAEEAMTGAPAAE